MVCIPQEPCKAKGWCGAGWVGCAGCHEAAEVNPVPLGAARVPGIQGSGWPLAPQAGSGRRATSSRALVLMGLLIPAPPGGLGLVEGRRERSGSLVLHSGSIGKPGALALSVPFGTGKGRIAASSQCCQYPRDCLVSSPALLHPPCCEAPHGSARAQRGHPAAEHPPILLPASPGCSGCPRVGSNLPVLPAASGAVGMETLGSPLKPRVL